MTESTPTTPSGRPWDHAELRRRDERDAIDLSLGIHRSFPLDYLKAKTGEVGCRICEIPAERHFDALDHVWEDPND